MAKKDYSALPKKSNPNKHPDAKRLPRLISILFDLDKQRFVNINCLANEFQVHKRTILRDLTLLEEMGVALYKPVGYGPHYRVRDFFHLKNFRRSTKSQQNLYKLRELMDILDIDMDEHLSPIQQEICDERTANQSALTQEDFLSLVTKAKIENSALQARILDAVVREYGRKKDSDFSIQIYQRLIQLRQEISDYYRLAFVYLDAKKYQEALNIVEKAISLVPENGLGYTFALRIYREMGNSDLMLQKAQEYLKKLPKDVYVNNGAASIFMKLKRYKDAVNCYRRTAVRGSILHYSRVAAVYQQAGELKKALEEINKGLKIRQTAFLLGKKEQLLKKISENKRN